MSLETLPHECVLALQHGTPGAREQLAQWLRAPLARIVDLAFSRIVLSDAPELLADRTFHWALMYLRWRDPSEFVDITVDRFVAQVQFASAKMLCAFAEPLPTLRQRLARYADAVWTRQSRRHNERRVRRGRARLPVAGGDGYSVCFYMQPCETVGGDWIGFGVYESDGVLWILVADVTGHGYPAYILASGLPHLWECSRIAQARAQGIEPTELLDVLSSELAGVLPDCIYVEAKIGRFSTGGVAKIAGAGNCPVVLRQSGEPAARIVTLGGLYLGHEEAFPRDQQTWELRPGDELMMASDGLFEQMTIDNRQLLASLAGDLGLRLASGQNLHEAALDTLTQVLDGGVQHDDIAIVTLQYSDKPPLAAEDTRSVTACVQSDGALSGNSE